VTAGLPLAEFTALLTRQLTESAVLADRRQRDDFVALATEVEGTIEDYVRKAVGCTDADRSAAAARYVTEVIGSLLPPAAPLHQAVDDALVRFGRGVRDGLIAHFGDAVKDALELGTDAETWVLERGKLERCALDKLRQDAEKRYVDIRTMLRTGVPRTQIRGGHLSVKVLLEEGSGGGVVARLPAADAAKGVSDAVSTLTLDFFVDAFPPFQ
jgi:hypothetical protein